MQLSNYIASYSHLSMMCVSPVTGASALEYVIWIGLTEGCFDASEIQYCS